VKWILITGGAGFVGCHLARQLSEIADNQLVLVDNFVRGKRDEELEAVTSRPNVQLVSADLSNASGFEQIGTGFDCVYHLAAIIGVKNVMERPWDVVQVNALSTLHLLKWFCAGGGRKLLFSSTSEAYAWTQEFQDLPVPTPEDVPLALTDLRNARSSYAGSKIFGELAVTHACASAGKAFVIVRYHNVYGPRMGYEHVIPELCKRALAGQNPLVVYSADHSRAFCYIADAISGTIAAMETEMADGQTINIGNDEEVSINDLAVEVLRTTKVTADIAPQFAAHDPIKRRCPDISRARQLLGYEPRVSLSEGLERTLAWYRPRLQATT
jgi:UDP-glucose 4-epimerase/UDP-glucuronate decarboxylase